MTFHVEEISFEKAWRVIRAMQTDKVFDNWIIIVRFSCHVNNKTILDNIKNYNYPRPIIKKLKAPLLYYLLPRPNCFCLYDTHLKNIYYLAKSCSLFLQFEILFIDKGKDYDLKKNILPEEQLYTGFLKIKDKVGKYFFCQLDTDNPHFASNTSQATDYNFVPDYLHLYFRQP